MVSRGAWTYANQCEPVVPSSGHHYNDAMHSQEATLAKKKPTSHRAKYTKEDIRQLSALIKAKTPMTEIGKAMGRTAAGVRMKAHTLGINPRRKRKTAAKPGRRASR